MYCGEWVGPANPHHVASHADCPLRRYNITKAKQGKRAREALYPPGLSAEEKERIGVYLSYRSAPNGPLLRRNWRAHLVDKIKKKRKTHGRDAEAQAAASAAAKGSDRPRHQQSASRSSTAPTAAPAAKRGRTNPPPQGRGRGRRSRGRSGAAFTGWRGDSCSENWRKRKFRDSYDDDDDPEGPGPDEMDHSGPISAYNDFGVRAVSVSSAAGPRVDVYQFLPPTRVTVAPAAVAAARSRSISPVLEQQSADALLSPSHDDLHRAIAVHLDERDADIACVRAFMAAHDPVDRSTVATEESTTAEPVTETTVFSPRESPEVVHMVSVEEKIESPATVVAAATVASIVAPCMLATLKSYSPAELVKQKGAYFAPANGTASATQWERRVHRGPAVLKLLFSTDAVRGVKVVGPTDFIRPCDSCARGKSRNRNFPPSQNPATKPGEALVIDGSGPFAIVGIDGQRYIVQAMDTYTKYTYAEAVATKAEAATTVMKFVKQADRVHRIQAVKWDGGKEYVNAALERYMAEAGIKILRNVPYTPQENSQAERNGKTIVQDIRVHLIESGVEPQYWPLLMRHVVVLMNMLPRQRLIIDGRAVSPFEAWTGHVPNLSGVRQVGCLVYWFDSQYKKRLVEIDDDGLEAKLGKWNATGQQGTHLGFADESGVNYNIIKHSDGQIATVTSLRFIENVKPCLRVTEHELVARGLLDDEAVNDIFLSIPEPSAPPLSRAEPAAPMQDLIEDLEDAQSDEDSTELEVKHAQPSSPQGGPPQGGQRGGRPPPLPPYGGPGVRARQPKPRAKNTREVDETAFHYDPLSKSDGGMPKDDPEYEPSGRKPSTRPLPAEPGQPTRVSTRPPPLPEAPVTYATSSRTTTTTAPSASSAPGESQHVPAQPSKGKGGSAEATNARDTKEVVKPKASAQPPRSKTSAQPSQIPTRPSTKASMKPPAREPGETTQPGSRGGSRELRNLLNDPHCVLTDRRRWTQGRPERDPARGIGTASAASAPSARSPATPQPVKKLPELLTLRLREGEVSIPTTWQEMKSSPLYPYWVEAWRTEVSLWKSREVFDIIPQPRRYVKLSCRPVCTVKAADGIVKRLKVRIVVREFNTGHDECYWSPTAECTTQRLLAAYAAKQGMTVARIDVVGAYLYAKLDQPIIVRAPDWPVCEDLMPVGSALRLKRAVYGLRDAAHAWNAEFNRTLLEYGWEQSILDTAFYVFRRPQQQPLLATLHVDDFLVTHRKDGRFEHFAD